MIAKVVSGTVIGINGHTVMVETDISQGLPSFDIVGLPDSAVKESKERVRTAINNSGLSFPIRRITVNLAPGDIRKEGPSFDLPIAVAILICMGVIDENKARGIAMLGELSLDGDIRGVSGILPVVINAKEEGIKKCIIPEDNKLEASLIEGIEVIGVKNLNQLINHFSKKPILPTITDITKIINQTESYLLDFSDVKGQVNVKKAMEISAAGGHNVLIIGPPGSGKTMLAKRFQTILPPLTFEESLDVTKIYSVSSLLENKNKLIKTRPFRSPHHTASHTALTGGGRVPKPGEISLAHNGVLFLDELPEFSRQSLETLRQPMEDRVITVSRVSGTIVFPANFLLIASMNPCPCGFYGAGDRCTCSENEIGRYLGKISGPLLDRIDIQVESIFINYEEISDTTKSETSEDIAKRVLRAREIQYKRYKREVITTNAELTAPLIEKYCVLNEDSKNLLKDIFDKLGLSARGYHKILKVARTLADLAEEEQINQNHIAQAISYRSLDRKYWY